MNRKAIVILAALGLVLALRYAFSTNPNAAFAKAVSGVDKIVIRNGGHDCCGNDVDSQPVFAEITDPETIAEFTHNIRFDRRYPDLLMSVSNCRCCGYPGVDWYRDGTRVALTSIQHGHAVRWSEFEKDETLTPNSARWLAQFMLAQQIPETQPRPSRAESDSIPKAKVQKRPAPQKAT